MTNRFFKFLPIAAALLMAVSCSRDDDGNAPASGSDGVQTVATNANTAKPIQIPFSITVGGKPSSLAKAQVVESESGDDLTQKFSEGDVLIITGDGLDKDNPSVLTITPEGINEETATFTGNLNLATEDALESGAKLTATLSNEKLGNEGQPLAAPVLVSNLEEAFEQCGYLVADFTYSDDDNPPQINLEQHTAFLVFDLPYTGEKVNVKIGGVTTPVFVSSNQVLSVPDGATVSSKRMSIDLTIDLLLETPGEAVDVVFDIKRDLQLPDDCVPGLFSVSADKQVFFSKGNLQYNPTQDKWQFAAHQYGICHTTDDNVGDDYANWTGKYTDLFGWGMWLDPGTLEGDNAKYTESIKPTQTSTISNYYVYYIDESDNNKEKIYEGDLNDLCRSAMGEDWTTLSNDEWIYLLGDDEKDETPCRKDAKALRATKTVNNVLGLVILPDGATADIANDSWEKLEKAGAVFLPAAGCRFGTGVMSVGGCGYYWSSSASGQDNACRLYFSPNYVLPDNADNRMLGHSVRLVRAL